MRPLSRICECWELYGELTVYNMSKNDPDFIHQLAVDAYGAQHLGGVTRSITTAFALIGLYLSVECGYTGKQVQKAHMELAKRRHDWPRFEPPHQTYSLTVFDVLRAEPGKKRDEMLKAWAEEVWKSWEHYHDWVRTFCHQWLHRSLFVFSTFGCGLFSVFLHKKASKFSIFIPSGKI